MKKLALAALLFIGGGIHAGENLPPVRLPAYAPPVQCPPCGTACQCSPSCPCPAPAVFVPSQGAAIGADKGNGKQGKRQAWATGYDSAGKAYSVLMEFGPGESPAAAPLAPVNYSAGPNTSIFSNSSPCANGQCQAPQSGRRR